MAKPKAYIDSCCIIEAVKGQRGLPLDHSPTEVDMAQRLMRAANGDSIELYTSIITIAEVIHLGEMPPPPDLKPYIERLILSGRNGFTAIAPSPQIVLLARDLATDDGLGGRVADRLHIATAMSYRLTEFITLDGKLANRISNSQVRGLRAVAPSETTILPAEYRTDDLFNIAKKD